MARTPREESWRVFYTVESANRALPLVRAIVRDVIAQWEVVSELERRLVPLSGANHSPGAHDFYGEELASQRAELETEKGRLCGYLIELDRLGVELKSVESGLCDFPSYRDGREICLCWNLGESAVAHWHELDAGFAGRRPLAIEDVPIGAP